MKFQKGALWTGNPHGRPRKKIEAETPPPPPLTDVKALAKERTGEALEVIAAIMRDAKVSAATRLQAAQALLDRGHGRPTQAVETTVNTFEQWTREELISYLTGTLIEGEALSIGHGDRKLDLLET